MLQAHLRGEHEDLREFNREAPEQLVWWLDGMMERDPEGRYQTVDEVIEVFQQIEREKAVA